LRTLRGSAEEQALDQKTTRRFMSTVGTQIIVLVAVVGAPAAALARG